MKALLVLALALLTLAKRSDAQSKVRISGGEVTRSDARPDPSRLARRIPGIVPDTSQVTIVRYRIDAASGGILNIKEFSGIRGLARRRP